MIWLILIMALDIDFRPSAKQDIAWEALHDDTTREVFYGGAAGGGKSYLGCAWQIKSRLQYPKTRGLIGREVLKDIKETTMVTFFEVASNFGLKDGRHYSYSDQKGLVKFPNGSEILLKELKFVKADPQFNSLGGAPFTDAFIEEGADGITREAYDAVNTRLRWKIAEYDLTPKCLMTSNPTKNWIYKYFYLRNMKGELPAHMKFIKALVDDNPDKEFVKRYKEQLQNRDPLTVARLLYGDWEYDSSQDQLCKYDDILDLFSNDFVPGGEKSISADIALMGSDLFVLIVWSGNRAERIILVSKCEANDIEDLIKEECKNNFVPISRVVVDADGVGSFLRGYLKGSQSFVAQSSPIKVEGKKEEYENLKAQLSYNLKDFINGHEMFVNADNVWWFDPRTKQYTRCPKHEFIERATQELEQLRRRDMDKDGPLKVIKKEDVKKAIGRSPDVSDALMMHGLLALRPKSKIIVTV